MSAVRARIAYKWLSTPDQKEIAVDDNGNHGLFSVRTAVIVLAGIVFGSAAGALHYLEYASPPGAVAAGLAVLAGSLPVLHKLIERPRRSGGGPEEGRSGPAADESA